RLQRHPPALELDEVSMLGERARHRRQLGPHVGEQLSGVHADIFNARTTLGREVPRSAQPLQACAAPTGTNQEEVSALLALTDNAVEAVKTVVSSSDDFSETSGPRMVLGAAARAGSNGRRRMCH